MSNQLPALPQGATGAPLVLAVNDRLRRIAQSTTTVTDAAATAQTSADAAQASADAANEAIEKAKITSQNVVTGSRVAGTVYQNTTGKVLWVSTCWNLAGTTSAITALSDASNPPTTEVGHSSDSSPQAVNDQLFLIVLPGNYYQFVVTGGTVTLVTWVEYS
jgi:hypothetical protein